MALILLCLILQNLHEQSFQLLVLTQALNLEHFDLHWPTLLVVKVRCALPNGDALLRFNELFQRIVFVQLRQRKRRVYGAVAAAAFQLDVGRSAHVDLVGHFLLGVSVLFTQFPQQFGVHWRSF